MKKSLILFSTLAAGLMAFGTLYSRQNNVISRAEDNEDMVEYSANESKWALKTNSVFNGEMEATNAQFNWLSKKSTFTSASYSTQQNLSLERLRDWKYEHFTINTSGESGIDGASGNPTSKNSVSLVWGFGSDSYAKIVEIDGDGTVVASKSIGRPGDYTVDAVGDLNCLNSFFLEVYCKPFSVSVNIDEKEAGVDFVFTIHAYDLWGAYSGGYTFDLAYSSTNVALKGERYLNVGRAGCGTVSDTEKIITKTVVDGAIYSSNSANWISCTNASFSGSGMDATNGQFNWVTNKYDIDAIDLTTNESLNIVRDADWKYEYLTISTSGEYGVDASGMTSAKNSVSFVWGWIPYAQIVEIDANGNKTATLVGFEKDIPISVADDNYATSLFRHTYDRAFNLKVDLVEVDEGVQFNFVVKGTEEYGGYPNGITVSFSYVAKKATLSGAKSIAYGRLGSGTVDADHKINIQLKVNEIPGEFDFINYTGSDATLSSQTNAVVSGKKAHLTASVGSSVITNHFNANATINITADYTNVGGNWGGFVVMLKGTSFDYKKTTWALSGTDFEPTVSSGNWVALQSNYGKIRVFSCVDGVVSVDTNAFQYVNGNDFWYTMKQRTDIEVTTTDTLTGVDFRISHHASGVASNTGNTYVETFSISNTKLHGRQSVGFFQVTGDGTFDATSNSVTIKAKSTASANANLVKDFIGYADELKSTEVTVGSFVPQYNRYAPLNDIYNQFEAGVYTTIDAALKTKFETLGANLKAVVASNTLTSLGATYELSGVEIVNSKVYVMIGIKTEFDEKLSDLDTEYGLQLVCGIKRIYCPFNGDETKKHVDSDNGMTYVTVNFGDCLSTDNCLEQTTLSFSLSLYIKANDSRNDTFKARDFSIAGMIDAYYNSSDASVTTAVTPIYQHLAANDCFE